MSLTARAELTPDLVNLGFGALSQFHDRVQIDTSGNTNEMKLYPYTSLGAGWNFSKHFSLLSDLGWVFPHSRSTNNVTRSCYYLNTHIATHWGSSFQVGAFAGLGLFLTSIKGDGGQVTLNNGTGTTDYPLPFDSALASNITYNAGAFIKYANISLEAMNSVLNLFDSLRRTSQISFSIKFNIPIDKPVQPTKTPTIKQEPTKTPTIKQEPNKYNPINRPEKPRPKQTNKYKPKQYKYEEDENFF